MIIVLDKRHTSEQKTRLVNFIRERGGKPSEMTLRDRLVVTFNESLNGKLDFLAFAGVEQVVTTQTEFKKSSWETQSEPTRIKVGNAEIGPGRFNVIAGPCAVESADQYLRIAHKAKKAGAHFLRGGAFKPRTSPFSFQGLGRSGLEILAEARKETDLPIITEALDVRDVEFVYKVTDVIQVGSRNMQNFPLLREVGKTDKPVLLKRGLAATIQEWLLAAEYVLEGGNSQVVLCERGIRSFDQETRNFLDLAAVPIVHGKSHLPVLVDPSHALGRRDLVAPMTKAALAAGANGVMIEIHDEPETALSDGFQAIHPDNLEDIIKDLKRMGAALDIYVP